MRQHIKRSIKKLMPASTYLSIRDTLKTATNYIHLLFYRKDIGSVVSTNKNKILLVDKRSMGGGSIQYSTKWQAAATDNDIILFDHQIYNLFEISVGNDPIALTVLTKEKLDHYIRELHISRIVINQLATIPTKTLWRLLQIIEECGVPYEYTIHDFFCLCPSITQMHSDHTYRGPECLSNPSCNYLPAIKEWQASWSRFLRGATKIRAVSDFAKRAVLQVYPHLEIEVEHPKIFSYPSLYNVSDAYKSPLIIGIMGHLSDIKGGDIVVRVAEKIAASQLPIQLKLFGTIDAPLSRAAQKVLSVLGSYNEKTLPHLIKTNHIGLFLFPSLVPETYSLVCSEIIQMGFPIVMFETGAQTERIQQGHFGWLVSLDNPVASMFTHILKLYTTRNLIEEKAKNIQIAAPPTNETSPSRKKEYGVAIVIANWNGKKFLRACLSSLFSQTYRPMRVIVVDNGSTDDSVPFLEKDYPAITVMRNKKNLGFAQANNIGIAEALRDFSITFVALLNNDTTVEPDWLQNLVTTMQSHTDIGIVGSKITQHTDHTIIDSVGDYISRQSLLVLNRGNGETDSGQYQMPEEVFTVSACACLIRRETLEDIMMSEEYFDNDFGNYVEDVDLCVRARLMGWLCWYTPHARVYHIGSGTSSKVSSSWKYRLTYRNRILFVLKNFPSLLTIKLLLYYVFPTRNEMKSALLVLVPWMNRFRRNPSKKPEIKFSLPIILDIYFGGIFDALRATPRMLPKRQKIIAATRISSKDIRGWFTRFSL